MTIPQTSADVVATSTVANKTVATWTEDVTTGAAPAKPARRLPVQKDWPTSAIVTVQIAILVGVIAFWEIGADTGFIDKFFWSHPSAIYQTLTIFFTTGDAFTDIAFTFR
jgi:NitT/TauT family transport system permease protein